MITIDEDYYIEQESIESEKVKCKTKIQNLFKQYCVDKYGDSFTPSESMKILFITTFHSDLLKDMNIEELL